MPTHGDAVLDDASSRICARAGRARSTVPIEIHGRRPPVLRPARGGGVPGAHPHLVPLGRHRWSARCSPLAPPIASSVGTSSSSYRSAPIPCGDGNANRRRVVGGGPRFANWRARARTPQPWRSTRMVSFCVPTRRRSASLTGRSSLRRRSSGSSSGRMCAVPEYQRRPTLTRTCGVF
jgi:hypothetical protein